MLHMPSSLLIMSREYVQALEPPQADAVTSAVTTLREVASCAAARSMIHFCEHVYDCVFIVKDI